MLSTGEVEQLLAASEAVMIRSIDIHTGDSSPLDTEVVVLSETACVLRLHIGGATVNIFGDLERQAEILRAAAALDAAFGDTELKVISEAAE